MITRHEISLMPFLGSELGHDELYGTHTLSLFFSWTNFLTVRCDSSHNVSTSRRKLDMFSLISILCTPVHLIAINLSLRITLLKVML